MLLFTTWWLPLALIGVFLYSLSSLFEKHTVDALFEDNHSWVITICLAAFLSTAVLVYSIEGFQPIKISVAVLAMLGGIVLIPSYYAYIAALKRTTPDIIAAIWQVNLFYALIIGYTLFGEVLKTTEIMGIIIILIAAIFVSKETADKKTIGNKATPFKKEPFYIVFCIVQIAIIFDISSSAIIDQLVGHNSVLQIMFWGNFGLFLVAIFLLCSQNRRNAFKHTLKIRGKEVVLFIL